MGTKQNVKHIGKILRKFLPSFLYRIIASKVVRMDKKKRFLTNYPARPSESFLVNNHDFINEPKFIEALTFASGEKENIYGSHDQYKFYMLLWATKQAMSLKADIVQCGVFVGTGAAAMVKYIDLDKHPSRRMFLIDTFTGIPEQDQTNPDEATLGAYGTQWLYEKESASAFR